MPLFKGSGINLRVRIPWLKNRWERKLIAASQSGNFDIVNELTTPMFLHRSIDVDIQDGYPLRVAVSCGHTEIASLLIKRGAKVNFGEGEPLRTAAAGGHVEIVSLLLEKGAAVNLQRSFKWQTYRGSFAGICRGKTALMRACRNGHRKTVETLIKAGADVDATANTNKDFELYSSNPHSMDRGPQQPCDTALSYALYNQHSEIVKLLMATNADIEGISARGGYLLREASAAGHVEAVKLLLAVKVDVNAADYFTGIRPLFLATIHGQTEIVKLLLAADADVNVAPQYMGTPLQEASKMGRTEIVRLLKEAGASARFKL